MSKRLLILADDEPVTTRALVLDLTDAGYRVETVADPDEAIRRSRVVPFDLLIATAERGDAEAGFVSRFRHLRPAAKVVLMTTEGARGSLEFDEAGARVRKPFDLDEFRALVDRLLRKGGETSDSAK